MKSECLWTTQCQRHPRQTSPLSSSAAETGAQVLGRASLWEPWIVGHPPKGHGNFSSTSAVEKEPLFYFAEWCLSEPWLPSVPTCSEPRCRVHLPKQVLRKRFSFLLTNLWAETTFESDWQRNTVIQVSNTVTCKASGNWAVSENLENGAQKTKGKWSWQLLLLKLQIK